MTTNENGGRASAPELTPDQINALPKAVELTLSSGVVVWIRPASLNDQRLIHEEMNKRHPLPREADFKIPVPDDQATIPGQTMTDTDSYRQAQIIANKERAAFFIRAHILTCLDFPEGADAVIARYLPEIQRKRKFLASIPADDLEAVIFHAVVQTRDDEKLIEGVITQTLPVEMSEVVSQLRIFRPANIGRRINHSVPDGREDALVPNVDAQQNGVAQNEHGL